MIILKKEQQYEYDLEDLRFAIDVARANGASVDYTPRTSGSTITVNGNSFNFPEGKGYSFAESFIESQFGMDAFENMKLLYCRDQIDNILTAMHNIKTVQLTEKGTKEGVFFYQSLGQSACEAFRDAGIEQINSLPFPHGSEGARLAIEWLKNEAFPEMIKQESALEAVVERTD